MSEKTLIIAEAGVNHNGRLDLALQLIDIAVEAGADIVKFQTFKTENLTSKNASMAEYQTNNCGGGRTQFQMLKDLEISEQHFHKIKNYCDQKGITFLSTPFDLQSIDFLKSLGCTTWKIPSGEITNFPLLKKIGSFKENVILSTGMSNNSEIKSAIEVITGHGTPLKNITLLQCTTEYPTRFEDINLNAMLGIKDNFQTKIGLSDHSPGIEVSLAAVALGACIIEKHFTIDKELPGPDHIASLTPLELKSLVRSIRNIELSLGTSEKKPTANEVKNAMVVRKSIFTSKEIKKGEFFSESNLTTKRPGTGISPMKLPQIIGTKATRDFKEGEMIE